MIKTQVRLPDELYREAKRIAREREMSLAEVVRRGIEYMASVYPPLSVADQQWKPPRPRNLGKFKVPVEDWRLLVNESEVPLEP
jgi:hypothetical protein